MNLCWENNIVILNDLLMLSQGSFAPVVVVIMFFCRLLVFSSSIVIATGKRNISNGFIFTNQSFAVSIAPVVSYCWDHAWNTIFTIFLIRIIWSVPVTPDNKEAQKAENCVFIVRNISLIFPTGQCLADHGSSFTSQVL